jgi:hypothetical protein
MTAKSIVHQLYTDGKICHRASHSNEHRN